MLPAKIPDTLDRVKEALEIWAEDMKHGGVKLGFPSRSIGFSSGGSWGHGYDDLEETVDRNTAKAVEAILEGLTISQRLAVHHYHLAAVWTSRRTRLEDDYADAIMAVEIGLRKRGLL
jgi:hypothetical protein